MSDIEYSLATPVKELETGIINTTDVDEMNDMVALFNLNMKKREIIRQSKLADLQDCVIEEMSQRLTKRNDNFSNDDLIKYLSAIDKSMINKPELTMDDIPKILINQQNNVQVNINGKEKLSSDERRRVLNAINQLLHSQGDADMVIEEED